MQQISIRYLQGGYETSQCGDVFQTYMAWNILRMIIESFFQDGFRMWTKVEFCACVIDSMSWKDISGANFNRKSSKWL